MDIHFTARKFKARETIKRHAVDSVKKLDKYYDGIVRADIVLSYERTRTSLKGAEINLHVYGTVLSAREKTEDFHKSVDLVLEKLERQLSKYKTKLRLQNKKQLRRVKESVTTPPSSGDEE